MPKAPVKLLIKQRIMRQVMLALLPTIAGAVYFFGWRSLFMVVWAGAVGFFIEYFWERRHGKPASEAVFVTTTIFSLIMPPTVPLHVLTIGVIFAVLITKEIFGGFAKNIFNPAMAGRCFVYVCFPIALTATWAPVAQGPFGAINRWSTVSTVDTVSSATPMAYLKAGKLKFADQEHEAVSEIPYLIEEEQTVYIDRTTLLEKQLVGRISGTVGVTSAILISIGGLYLFVKKVASRAIILSLIITYAVVSHILYLFGVPPVPTGWTAVLGGGFLFGAFYMATDPISAPKTREAQIAYGVIIALCTVVIRNFSIFNGGLMFSLLIGNMFAPILDYLVRWIKPGKKRLAR